MDDLDDPLHRRALRVLRVAWSAGILGDVPIRSLPAALGVVREKGLNAAMLHSLHARMHPARLALVDAWRTVTWAQADEEIAQAARAMRSRLGLATGEAVAIALENRAEYVLGWFATMRARVRVVHAGSHLTASELVHLVRTANVRAVLVSRGTQEMLREARALLPDVELRVVHCGDGAPAEALTWAGLCASGGPSQPLPLAPAENVVFTSGTTGAPRGAARDFGAFGATELARVLERLPFTCGERHLVVAPVSHSAPQVFTLVHTALGSTVQLLPHFEAATTLRTLSTERITSTFLVPTMLRRMLELSQEVHQATPTPELRAVVLGSSELGEDLRRGAIARFGARTVFDFYGATELGWVTLIRGDEMLEHPGSVGRPLSGQRLRILDEQGRRCPPRVTGLVGVRNAQTMLGYTGDEQATRETVRGGWSTVEDLGWVDEAGYLYLAGRARDMVKSGGVNVYPAEVERVLQEDPQVREVAVIGVADRDWGERVVAVVVPRDGAFDAEEAKARARRTLSPAKVPREWHLVEHLPRNANGKVLKKELRARFGHGWNAPSHGG